MIPVDNAAVARLRTRVRAAIKACPALTAERKRVRRNRPTFPAVGRTLFGFGGIATLLSDPVATGALPRAADLFHTWVLAITALRAQEIISLSRDPAQLAVPYALPVTDDAVFAAHQRIVTRHSLWIAGDAAVFAGLVATFNPRSAAGWLAVPLFIVAHWATALALGRALALFPRVVPFVSGGTIMLLLAAIATLLTENRYALLQIFGPVFPALSSLTPPGWIQNAFVHAISNSSWNAVALIAALAAGAAAALPVLRRRLRARFDLDAAFGTADDPAPQFAAPEETAPNADVPAVNVANVAARLRHELDQPRGMRLFARGYLERWVVRLLLGRQRGVLDYLESDGVAWDRGWVIGLICVLVTRLVQTQLAADAMLVAGCIGTGIVALWTLPLLGGTWRALNAHPSERVHLAVAALHPVGFSAMVSTMLAVNVLRIAIAGPLFVLAAMFCFTPAPLPLFQALEYAVRGLGVLAAAQPMLVLLQFAQHTSTAGAWWRVVMVLLFALLLILGLGLSLTALLIESSTAAGGLVLTLAAFGTLALALYGRMWNGRFFDLARIPRQ